MADTIIRLGSSAGPKGRIPIEKNIRVVDANGNEYEATWPKRAKGLVKNGRARFISDDTICLACPPNQNLEDTEMTTTENTAKATATKPAEKATELKLTETKKEIAEETSAESIEETATAAGPNAPELPTIAELSVLINSLARSGIESEDIPDAVNGLYMTYKKHQTEQAKYAGLKSAEASKLLAKLAEKNAISITDPAAVMEAIAEL